ncbi:hypothetical protein ABAC402_19100 [Asticcacaulis sp. AC402]|nr:hypothetical protein ABAC402_19100 [Asticcacaulis sp. AC402]
MLLSASVILSAVTVPHAMAATDPVTAVAPSAEAFGKLPALTSMTLSPDGKHMAAIVSPDGKVARIAVWEVSALNVAPTQLALDPRVSLVSVSFVKDGVLAVETRQLFGVAGEDTHLFQTLFTDLKGSKWSTGLPRAEKSIDADYKEIDIIVNQPRIVSTLPLDPDNILIQDSDGAVYKSNPLTGKYLKVAQIGQRETLAYFDQKGVLRAKVGIELNAEPPATVQFILNPETRRMEEHFRAPLRERDFPSVVGLTPDPNIVLVQARRDKDNTVVYNYDIKNKAFVDIAFEHPLFDAGSVLIAPESLEPIVFYYEGERPTAYYVNENLESLMKGIAQALGVKSELIDWTTLNGGKKVKFRVTDGPDVNLVDISNNRATAIISLEGSAQPATYYLYQEGQPLVSLGSARPDLDTTLLGDGYLTQFTARDGRPIPAFVYRPNETRYGTGPYPTIILPHGGPWARDYNDSIDPWVQYFVARGYLVAKPQFRGSAGWGLSQLAAGDNRWGLEMSDDMDDVALGLVAQGLANKDRLAIHGYSFGGYSAMAAVVRPNQIYQCAMSGAGPASPSSMKYETGMNRVLEHRQRPFVDGLDARSAARSASIPILIYHGDRDTNVRPAESEIFHGALRGAGKTTERVVFKDMGHGSVTWSPENMIDLLKLLEVYVTTKCGPDGL